MRGIREREGGEVGGKGGVEGVQVGVFDLEGGEGEGERGEEGGARFSAEVGEEGGELDGGVEEDAVEGSVGEGGGEDTREGFSHF